MVLSVNISNRYCYYGILFFVVVCCSTILLEYVNLYPHRTSLIRNLPLVVEDIHRDIYLEAVEQTGNTLRFIGQNTQSNGTMVQASVNLDKLKWTVDGYKKMKQNKYSLSHKALRPITDFQHAKYFLEPWEVPDIRCDGLFAGSAHEQLAALTKMEQPRPYIESDSFISFTKNCKSFKTNQRYILSPLTKEENEFPIAYSILVFNGTDQFNRLLRAIYRPQNVYCVHVDTKSTTAFKNSIKGIANCFKNVFLSSRSVDVQWGEFTVLEPELICMEDLLKYKRWKYFINLTGQEFPLRTNSEIVNILKILNGSNDVDATIKR